MYEDLKKFIKTEINIITNIDTDAYPPTLKYKEGVLDAYEIILDEIMKIEQKQVL